MTPKEKASELFNKFYKWVGFNPEAKHCVMIVVEEILNLELDANNEMSDYPYWQQVKEEIEKL